jgi:two-component system chemotaxis response regulator CheB
MEAPDWYEAVVIGVSAGGMQALKTILPSLPASFPLPIVIVQHVGARSDNFLAEYLANLSSLKIKEAEGGEKLSPGTAYLAPAGYHLLIEPDRTFSLSVDPRLNYACPSIDMMFESAADVFKRRLIGIILTGANADGAQGLKKIKKYGGLAIVQNPNSAEAPYMPQAALDVVRADYIADLEKIGTLLLELNSSHNGGSHGVGANG